MRQKLFIILCVIMFRQFNICAQLIQTGDEPASFPTIFVNGITYSITDSVNNQLCVIKADCEEENIVIPDFVHYNANDYCVTSIGNRAFLSSNAHSIVIPPTITQIGQAAFYDCKNLSSVTLPFSVTKIGEYAFYGCSSLVTVQLPERLAVIPKCCFGGCVSLSDILLPKFLLSVEYEAFVRCVSLNTICIPESIAEFDFTSLKNCSNMSTLSLLCDRPDTLSVYLGFGDDMLFGNSITLIVPEGTFELYDSLWKSNTIWGQFARITDGKQTTHEKSFNNNGIIYRITDAEKQYVNVAHNYAVGDIAIPLVVESPLTQKQYSVQGFDNKAFYENGCLTSIRIPQGFSSVPDSCFFHCWQLTSVLLPNSIKDIGQESFSGCTDLRTIIIPKNVTVLPEGIFNGCFELSSIELPKGLKTIGRNALADCHSLKSIDIPTSVDSIGVSAFNSCWSLKSVTVPRKVTIIPNSMFEDCFGLQRIRMKGRVLRIGDSAFENCYKLNDFVIPHTVKSIGNNAFNHGEPHGLAAWSIYSLYYAN